MEIENKNGQVVKRKHTGRPRNTISKQYALEKENAQMKWKNKWVETGLAALTPKQK